MLDATTLRAAVQRERLLDTALRLIAIPSRTGEAGAVSDELAAILRQDGFAVERPVGGHPKAPAVAARLESGRPGPTLVFNGHLDTVHLPFVEPGVNGDRITGSGSSDMKGGVAAAVEALRVLRDTRTLTRGSILLLAHDLHEAPWGDGGQLNQLIADGYCGDAVLIPEYLNQCVATIGRGMVIWKATISRAGAPVHEVQRLESEPSVIAAAARLVQRLELYEQQIRQRSHPDGGCDSVFIGQIHSGEIYNQFPRECWLEGTRRWLPGLTRAAVEAELLAIFAEVAAVTGTRITARFNPVREAFHLPVEHPFVKIFQTAHAAVSGQRLPFGLKPFCDDGNSFSALAGIPAITHGPRAAGAHTLEEWASISDLCRIAWLYALTAVLYCVGEKAA